MSTKRSGAISLAETLRPGPKGFGGPPWEPNPADPVAVSTALAVTVALLRALRGRGLLSDGEIDDLFDDAAGQLGDTPRAQNLLDRLRAQVDHKDEE
jgi:hypothetical protein